MKLSVSPPKNPKEYTFLHDLEELHYSTTFTLPHSISKVKGPFRKVVKQLIFQFLNNITYISTHFFIYTYLKKLQITLLKLLHMLTMHTPFLGISILMLGMKTYRAPQWTVQSAHYNILIGKISFKWQRKNYFWPQDHRGNCHYILTNLRKGLLFLWKFCAYLLFCFIAMSVLARMLYLTTQYSSIINFQNNMVSFLHPKKWKKRKKEKKKKKRPVDIISQQGI